MIRWQTAHSGAFMVGLSKTVGWTLTRLLVASTSVSKNCRNTNQARCRFTLVLVVVCSLRKTGSVSTPAMGRFGTKMGRSVRSGRVESS